jgi:UDP-glucose 4-epimerase
MRIALHGPYTSKEADMARYVVTGGAGFIGSHLVDSLLRGGHHVRVVDDLSTGRRENLNRRAELIEGDIADAALMHSAMQGATGCFHLAAIASVAHCNLDWLETHRTNMFGTVSVMQAAQRHGNVPVVYASSAAIYGEQHVLPISEACQPAPRSSYGADKLGAELQANAANIVHGLPSLGLRFFNVYGPRQDPASPYSGVISLFADRLARGQELTINGDGGQSRDFIFVGDIVRFLVAGMEVASRTGQAHVVNACTGRATTVRDLVWLLADVIGARPRIQHGPARPGDIRSSLGDSDRAARLLGTRAQVMLRDGLMQTFAPASMAQAA